MPLEAKYCSGCPGPPTLPGVGHRMPGLESAQAKKEAAEAMVTSRPKTACNLPATELDSAT